MTAWLLIAARWALYIDLGMMFGVPLFGLYALNGAEDRNLFPFRPVLGGLAALGMGLSLLGFALMAAAMTATDMGGLDRDMLQILLFETSAGAAFVVRMCASAVALLSALFFSAETLVLMLWTATGAIAVGSLAWSGHGVADSGELGAVHLAGDILHLLAASAWVGALAMLTSLLLGKSWKVDRAQMIHDALARFGIVGIIVVGLIVFTGLLNSLFLFGSASLWSLRFSPYGRLLAAKLFLFAGMLGLAAINRYSLTTQLAEALERQNTADALMLLRRSLAAETGLAVSVLAIVAWLGTVAPPVAST